MSDPQSQIPFKFFRSVFYKLTFYPIYRRNHQPLHLRLPQERPASMLPKRGPRKNKRNKKRKRFQRRSNPPLIPTAILTLLIANHQRRLSLRDQELVQMPVMQAPRRPLRPRKPKRFQKRKRRRSNPAVTKTPIPHLQSLFK